MLVAAAILALAAPAPAYAQSDTDKAHAFFRSAQSSFESGNKAQALTEFRLAYKLGPSSATLYWIAACEYHLDLLKDARMHYQQFLAEEPGSQYADNARLRVQAIEARKSVLVINTVPDGVDVAIAGDADRQTGQAPNPFQLPPGRYRVTLSKANYGTQTFSEVLDVGETRSLFRKLDPIPARLAIHTLPEDATLYVRGNRAQNPYMQDVEPGTYEIYAEATAYGSKRESYTLTAGENRSIVFELPYIQRSGRPELIGFWTATGAIGAGMAVVSLLADPDPTKAVSVTLIGAAGLVGGIVGGVTSTAFVPDYIRDNRALFRIGAMWMGAAEGATLGLAFSGNLASGWIGGTVGLGAGTVLGTWLDDKAPNYGRVALLQSAAVTGALAGALAVPALRLDPANHAEVAILTGLNAGLGAGLALAYLPDQSAYGPTWQRVTLVDLAGAAGLFAGALMVTIGDCIRQNIQCKSFASDAPTAQGALVGAALGLGAGWFLTRHYDKNRGTAPEHRVSGFAWPVPAPLASVGRDGRQTVVPGLATQGLF